MNYALKQRAAAVVLVFVCGSGLIQTASCDDHSAKIRAEAVRMSDALLNGDYQTVADYTFPWVLKEIGGEKKMLEVLKQSNLQMQNQGIRYSSVNIGSPEPVREIDGKWYALVPETIRIEVPQGILIQESHLLAVSEDKGNRWYFVDTASLAEEEKLAAVFPALVGKMKIPIRKQPVLTSKKQGN